MGGLLAKKRCLYGFNYRVGVLVFIILDTKNLPSIRQLWFILGRHLLKWVQKESCRFGGDPANVTIAGQKSTGSVSVNCHPHLQKDFHKSDLKSGTKLFRGSATTVVRRCHRQKIKCAQPSQH